MSDSNQNDATSWTMITPGSGGGVTITKRGTVSFPNHIRLQVFGQMDRAELLVNGKKIGLRGGLDPHRSYSINQEKKGGRARVKCKTAVQAAYGGLPGKVTKLDYQITKLNGRKTLVVDLSQIDQDDEPENRE